MPDPSVSSLPAPTVGSAGDALAIPLCAADGARFELLCVVPAAPHRLLYWLPAMGVPARHYLPLAEALAASGVGVVLHEWRGIGSSNRRAGRHCDWGYRELLQDDLAAGMAALRQRWPQARCSVGGHSLGGQLGLLVASLHPDLFDSLVLVASGAPYWRNYRHGWAIGLAMLLAPMVANLRGHLPGRRLGFAGNEARGVIADWARSGRSGRYAASGMNLDFESRLAALRLPVLALRLRDDWLGPAASLDWLLGKLGPCDRTLELLEPRDLAGAPADHFSWMKTPAPVARRMADWLDALDTAPSRGANPAA
ncbi:alpha/beta hydrolase [Rhodanobacter sp. B05]|uniref:alpha/beta hydrolase family protein n=1 Tax=Rhodanobacter sp. B05 TaxID=1945859 RepID=UPI0009873B99|nr:alpha/beta fold hydrolase [Rhodanobacter sp. B05]OOG52676.1 alpha/beta hydrolase [Rhodanobacter sp. B05]